MTQKNLYKTKTFWTGAATILAAFAGYKTGTMDPGTAAQTALTGLTAIFLRDAMVPKTRKTNKDSGADG